MVHTTMWKTHVNFKLKELKFGRVMPEIDFSIVSLQSGLGGNFIYFGSKGIFHRSSGGKESLSC